MTHYYQVGIGYHETTYVERDVLVLAENAGDARAQARSGNSVDEAEERSCEPLERYTVKVLAAPILIDPDNPQWSQIIKDDRTKKETDR